MNDLTAVAVGRQLKAMGAEEYMLGVFDRMADKMRNVRCTGADGVLRKLAWLRAMNADGRDIYIRPAGDQHDLILVDDLEYESIEQMIADGIHPAALVETSRENYQAWIRVGEVLPRHARRGVARALAASYGGDMRAAHSVQYGRLAGFTNRKEEHMDKYGKSPWVLIKDWRGSAVDAGVAQRLIDSAYTLASDDAQVPDTQEDIPDLFDQSAAPSAAQAKRPARAAYEGAMRYTINAARRRGEDVDLHVCDWRVCNELAKKGYSPPEVADAMMHQSPDLYDRKPGRAAVDYVRRTVSKSFSMFANNPFSSPGFRPASTVTTAAQPGTARMGRRPSSE